MQVFDEELASATSELASATSVTVHMQHIMTRTSLIIEHISQNQYILTKIQERKYQF
jgi:hypothetical protein